MNFFIALLVCFTTSFSGAVPETVKFSLEDARVRRDSVSYATSVIHQNPKYPDQRAESSIKVDFHSNNQHGRNAAGKRPKSVSDQLPMQQTFVSQHAHNGYKDPSQTQSFNVGYSVRFNGKSQPTQEQPLQSDIITGSRNKAVQKPHPHFDAQEYVNNALIDIKKQKISGIKPKPNKYTIKDDSKSFIPNLAPKTQQYLSYLSNSKPTASSNRFKPLPPKPLPTKDSAWTSLSPTIEIYHSKDASKNNLKQNRYPFNQDGVNGHTFQYPTVMEVVNPPNNQNLYDRLKATDEPLVPFIDKPKPESLHSALQIVPVQQIQLSQTPSESIQTHNFEKPNLPVDLSLLRVPVLTTSNANIASDQHTIPIPFDTTLLQAMKQNLNLHKNSHLTNEQKQFLQSDRANGQSSTHHIHVNGNNQPGLVVNSDNFNEYFNRYLESVQSQESRIENSAIPFKGASFNNRANSAKDMEFDLRPPPIGTGRSSQLYTG